MLSGPGPAPDKDQEPVTPAATINPPTPASASPPPVDKSDERAPAVASPPESKQGPPATPRPAATPVPTLESVKVPLQFSNSAETLVLGSLNSQSSFSDTCPDPVQVYLEAHIDEQTSQEQGKGQKKLTGQATHLQETQASEVASGHAMTPEQDGRKKAQAAAEVLLQETQAKAAAEAARQEAEALLAQQQAETEAAELMKRAHALLAKQKADAEARAQKQKVEAQQAQEQAEAAAAALKRQAEADEQARIRHEATLAAAKKQAEATAHAQEQEAKKLAAARQRIELAEQNQREAEAQALAERQKAAAETEALAREKAFAEGQAAAARQKALEAQALAAATQKALEADALAAATQKALEADALAAATQKASETDTLAVATQKASEAEMLAAATQKASQTDMLAVATQKASEAEALAVAAPMPTQACVMLFMHALCVLYMSGFWNTHICICRSLQITRTSTALAISGSFEDNSTSARVCQAGYSCVSTLILSFDNLMWCPDTGPRRHVCSLASQSWSESQSQQATKGALIKFVLSEPHVSNDQTWHPHASQEQKSDVCELPQLTEEEQQKYKSFWGRFRSNSNLDLGSTGSQLASCFWFPVTSSVVECRWGC